MASPPRKSYGVPHNRLTSIGNRMLTVLEDPEYRDVKAVVILTDAAGGGMALSGYIGNEEMAVADVLLAVRAHMRTMGKELRIGGL